LGHGVCIVNIGYHLPPYTFTGVVVVVLQTKLCYLCLFERLLQNLEIFEQWGKAKAAVHSILSFWGNSEYRTSHQGRFK